MVLVNKDLQREREKCTFNVEELIILFDGDEHKTKQRRERDRLILCGKETNDDVSCDELGHKEMYEENIKKSVIIFDQVRRMQGKPQNKLMNYRKALECALSACSSRRDGTPLVMHYIMFMPVIISQGTQEQQDRWLPRAWDGRIIGSYAQTELGHGTFIRGLETTATYDPETEQFILHSPTLSSCKWWSGSLGQTANYSIVVAQLYTKGKCQGVHSFIVQVRDEDTHQPLPGITVGDIGGKMGLQPVNNGFLAFNQVRIPRDHMLMKYAKVLKDGTYVESTNNKLLYAAMVFVRVMIVSDSTNYLTRAVTIATRYSAVRRQTPKTESGPEVQILDYLTQQHKLFIGIATCYANKIVANKLWNIFFEVNDEVAKGNYTRLPELHALACCMKAGVTSESAGVGERARLACGGHGFSRASYLPHLAAQLAASCTYEGDNTVLLLQTARFLVKTWQRKDSHPLTNTVAYIKTASAESYSMKWENTLEGIIRGLQVMAVKKIAKSVEVMETRCLSGMPIEDAWNMTSIQLVAAAEAHCRVVLITFFHEGVKDMSQKASTSLKCVLWQLVELYVIYWALEKLSDLLKYTNISLGDAEEMQTKYELLLQELRPNAVGLVDGFDIRDEIIQSALGSYDGRVYERLMEDAMKCSLNKEAVNSTFNLYLKPYMQSKL